MAKVSIIVPVYNVEKFISKCIESILSQTFKDIELILVDDNSTDNSLEICEEYKRKDKRIIITRNRQKGVSSARNIGIEMSSGEWISFIDSDDWIDCEMIEKLYNIAINSNSEIIMCGAYVDKLDERKENPFYNAEEKLFEGNEKLILQKQAISDIKGQYKPPYIACGVPWAKLYKKEFLIKNNLKFDTRLPRMQDMIFNLYAFEKAISIEYVNKFLYHYRQNSESVCNIYDERMLDKYESMLIALKEFVASSKNKNKLMEVYNLKVLATLNSYSIHLLSNNAQKGKLNINKDKIEKFVLAHKESLEQVNIEYLNSVQKIKLGLVNKNRIKSFIYLMNIINIKYRIKKNKYFK